MSATDSKTIRKNLKAKGITSRQVSVRNSSYSMGSSVYVTIKDPTVPFDLVEEIAMAEQRVRRCEITHDILSGGNMFVQVSYSREAEAVLAEPFIAPIAEAFAKVEGDTLERVNGTNFFVGRSGGDLELWHNRRVVGHLYQTDIEGAAFRMARLLNA